MLATEAGRVADMLTIPGEGDEKRRMGKRRTEIGGPNEDIAIKTFVVSKLIAAEMVKGPVARYILLHYFKDNCITN